MATDAPSTKTTTAASPTDASRAASGDVLALVNAELDALGHTLRASIGAGQGFALHLAAEDTSFVRLNRGKVRQPGSVRQLDAELVLYDGAKQAAVELSLTGDPSDDRDLIKRVVRRLQGVVTHSPDDPLLLRPPEPVSTEEGGLRDEPTSPEAMVETVLAAAEGHDLVGILTEGTMARGFLCDRGQRNTFATRSYVLDYSVYQRADKAVKDIVAGPVFDAAEVAARMGRSAARSEVLLREEHVVAPGRYRAYFAPSAVHELFFLAAHDGFSRRAVETRRSPLLKLYDKKRSLDPRIEVHCRLAGAAPSFSAEGWVRPSTLALIDAGQAAAPLCSARTAAEFGGDSDGVGADEAPTAIEMAGGDLPEAEVLERLGTGLYLSDLWYSNWSDKNAARLTGMTRFASVWVEDGVIKAPIRAARFDDSLYRLWGEHLEALTVERQIIPDTNTYGRRHPGQAMLPGMLVSALDITL